MKPNKSFSATQVLHIWLETQIGSAKHVQPHGYEMPGGYQSTWPEIRSQAANVVESIPLYPVARQSLVNWCTASADARDKVLTEEFLSQLDARLLREPISPATIARDRKDAVTSTRWMTDHEVSERIRKPIHQVRKCLNSRPSAFPHGSYQYRRTWNIHPLDVPIIEEAFGAIESY